MFGRKENVNQRPEQVCLSIFVSSPTYMKYFQARAMVNSTMAGTGFAMEGRKPTQGDPAVSMRFCVALHLSLQRLDAACCIGGGMARADDITAIGPAQVVFPADCRLQCRCLQEGGRNAAISIGKRPSRKCSPGQESCQLAPQRGSSWPPRRSLASSSLAS